jgi:two-component system, cell cycle response regulator DivK
MTDTPAGDTQPLILVVDDYPDAREMYADYLELCGYRVAQAGNGAEALEQVHALRPDVILMDMSLPIMDGWEATRRLKADERTRAIPVVALTGHPPESQGQSAGCDAYVLKPCLPEELTEQVQRVLGQRRAAG